MNQSPCPPVGPSSVPQQQQQTPSNQQSHLIAALNTPLSNQQQQQIAPQHQQQNVEAVYDQTSGGGPMRPNPHQMQNRPPPANIAPYSSSPAPVNIQSRPMGHPIRIMTGPPPQQGGHPQHQQMVRAPSGIIVQQQLGRSMSGAPLQSIQSGVPPIQQPQPIQQVQQGGNPQQPQPPPHLQVITTHVPVNAGPVQLANVSGSLLEKTKLEELARQVEPNLVLEEQVKDALVEIADEFVDDVLDKVCRLAIHRGNTRLEVRDVELVLELVYKMPAAPRAAVHVFGAASAAKTDEKLPATLAHQQRLQLLKKALKKT